MANESDTWGFSVFEFTHTERTTGGMSTCFWKGTTFSGPPWHCSFLSSAPPLPSPFKQCPRPNSLYFLPLSDVSHRAIFPVVLQVHRGGEGVVTSQLQRARLWHSSLTISLTKPSCLACYWAAHPFSPPMSLLLLFLLFPGQLLNIFRGLIR